MTCIRKTSTNGQSAQHFPTAFPLSLSSWHYNLQVTICAKARLGLQRVATASNVQPEVGEGGGGNMMES